MSWMQIGSIVVSGLAVALSVLSVVWSRQASRSFQEAARIREKTARRRAQRLDRRP